MTVGYRVFVCDNMAFHGDFTPVLAKHTKRFQSRGCGFGRRRSHAAKFRTDARQIGTGEQNQIGDPDAKLVIYRAFVEGELEAPKHLGRRVHDLYFNPQFEEFAPRTLWSMGNAFTSAFKELLIHILAVQGNGEALTLLGQRDECISSATNTRHIRGRLDWRRDGNPSPDRMTFSLSNPARLTPSIVARCGSQRPLSHL